MSRHLNCCCSPPQRWEREDASYHHHDDNDVVRARHSRSEWPQRGRKNAEPSKWKCEEFSTRVSLWHKQQRVMRRARGDRERKGALVSVFFLLFRRIAHIFLCNIYMCATLRLPSGHTLIDCARYPHTHTHDIWNKKAEPKLAHPRAIIIFNNFFLHSSQGFRRRSCNMFFRYNFKGSPQDSGQHRARSLNKQKNCSTSVKSAVRRRELHTTMLEVGKKRKNKLAIDIAAKLLRFLIQSLNK